LNIKQYKTDIRNEAFKKLERRCKSHRMVLLRSNNIVHAPNRGNTSTAELKVEMGSKLIYDLECLQNRYNLYQDIIPNSIYR